MQAATERRVIQAPRVPIDVMVELSHDGFEEPFEADALNLGVGGLAMRAAYLPEVGSRLMCRFECPPDGGAVETDAEVVWSNDTGEHMGQFGVRFVDPDPSVHRAIRALVGDDALPDERKPQVAKLHLDGVPTPIVARISHRADDILTVEQELPFLKLGKSVMVTGDGAVARRGRLEAVDLRIEGDTPRLMLAVVYEDEAPAAEEAPLSTVGGEPTWPDLVSPTAMPEAAPEIVDTRARADGDTADDMPAPARHEMVPAAMRVEAGREEPRVVRVVDEERILERDPEVEAMKRSPLRDSVAPALARVAPVVARVRVLFAALFAKVGPHAVKLGTTIKAHALRAYAAAKPVLAKVTARSGAWLSAHTLALREKLGTRFPALAPAGAKKRRMTAPPPAAVSVPARARRVQNDEVEPVVAPNRRRTLAISALAFVGVALAVYVLAPRGDSSRVQAHREVVAAPVATAPAVAPAPVAVPAVPAVAAPVPAPGPAVAAPAPDPELGAVTPIVLPPPPPVAVRMPTALPAPSYEVGPMPAPTYPSIQNGMRTAAPSHLAAVTPAGAPTASPYAVDVRGERVAGRDPTAVAPGSQPVVAARASFGAATVPSPRSFTLRMSGTVTGVRGMSDAGGFTVVVPGVLALDRAGPIAATMPDMVARAMILNRGDRAELTVRFVEGRTPAFRVVPRGASIEVQIARR